MIVQMLYSFALRVYSYTPFAKREIQLKFTECLLSVFPPKANIGIYFQFRSQKAVAAALINEQ